MRKNLPSIAKIDDISFEEDDRVFSDFKILHSKKGSRHSLIPTDIGLCDDCLKEMNDPNNRRYDFPFTNCTVCGARYSLITDVPYDRERTSMDKFKLCKNCEKEYTDPLNRRYHAQTISCPVCGPVYSLYDKKHKNLASKDAVKIFADKIEGGFFGIIKSWGGMHLCCSLKEIKKLRKWYNRPQKAFAIMVKDIDAAEKFGKITPVEKDLLLSRSKPIVLVEKKKAELASPGLDTIGLFLPYTGLHYLLFNHLKSDALVMTSANVPGEPMLLGNKDAFSLKADYYLLHNRDVPNRVDDSVIRVWNNHTFFIRKSRGYVPSPIPVNYDKRILSVGAGENITGAVSSESNVYLTQYIGNSKYYATLNFLEESLRHIMSLFMKKQELDAVGMDMHPSYFSRDVAKRFAGEFSAPVFEVQHHHAHAASLLLDQGADEAVVLTLDGLGYGDDGCLWGGEVLFSDFNNYKRMGHLENIPLLGGDKATHDPRRLVFAIFKHFDKEPYFKGNEAVVLSKLMAKSPMSSSLGRILDALSCYLEICDKRTYDGRPAMLLESLATKPLDFEPIINRQKSKKILQTTPLFNFLLKNIDKDKGRLAATTQMYIAKGLYKIAREENKKLPIVFSGGVAYNSMISEYMMKNNVLFNKEIPCGDGGICYGQAYLANL